MLFKVLCALRIEENIQKPVCQLGRFQWSHVAKMAIRLVLITINAKSLEAFVSCIGCCCKPTISVYFSPLTVACPLLQRSNDSENISHLGTTSCMFHNTLVFKTGLCSCTQGAIYHICESCMSRVIYTGCPGRNVPDFWRVFLMLKYADITQSTYVQS